MQSFSWAILLSESTKQLSNFMIGSDPFNSHKLFCLPYSLNLSQIKSPLSSDQEVIQVAQAMLDPPIMFGKLCNIAVVTI